MSEFDNDLARVRADIDDARDGLLQVVASLQDADLDRARRGGWSVRRVLEHLVQSEVLYVRLACGLRDLPQPEPLPAAEAPSVAVAQQGLRDARAALIAALDGVDEETFYALRTVGPEEYSLLSLLENVALHDREHGPQIRDILAATSS